MDVYYSPWKQKIRSTGTHQLSFTSITTTQYAKASSESVPAALWPIAYAELTPDTGVDSIQGGEVHATRPPVWRSKDPDL